MAQLVKLEEKIPTKPKVNDDDFDKILIKVYENYNIYFNNPVLQLVINLTISSVTT